MYIDVTSCYLRGLDEIEQFIDKRVIGNDFLEVHVNKNSNELFGYSVNPGQSLSYE